MSRAWLGHPVIHLDRCTSTSDELLRLAGEGAGHGTVVTAAEQSEGRGRLGRTWHSPKDAGLYLSLLLRPEAEPSELPPITLAAGIAVCETARALGVGATLKWPNDVLVADPSGTDEVRALGGRKLAGILTEMQSRGSRVMSAIIGIGMNLGPSRAPEPLASRITSLAEEVGDVPREQVLSLLLDHLEIRLDQFLVGGVAAIADDWLNLSGMAAARVSVTGGGETVVGTVRGLSRSGGLELMVSSGQVVEIVAGEVRHVD